VGALPTTNARVDRKEKFMSTTTSFSKAVPSFIHLDMARGLAALVVLIGHLRSFVFLSYGDLKSHTPIDIVVWAITGFGHQAVMLFFVLSGFFISRSILVDDRTKGFTWPVYLIKRLTRLWIVLLPCLVLTLLCDRTGMSLSGMQFYDGQLYGMYNSGPNSETGGIHLNFSTFFGNLFFLQTIIAPIFGSNGPLWSLANEFWYYLMFPLLYIAVTRRWNWWVIAVNLALFVVTCLFVGRYMALSGLIWGAGALSYIIYERGWFAKALGTYTALGTSMTLLLFSLAVSKSNYGTDFAKDFFIGLAAASLVLVLARYEGDSAAYHKSARTLANCSYTMYLVHFPFMALLVNVILHNNKFEASFLGYSVFIGLGLVTLIYCYMIYWLFERHTGKIRRYCLSKYKQATSGALRA
jgi:peptidoglycan/LPS O-acetylase OafA/YrhL